ncbi:hypothetical protein D3C74_367350 [compost metagenome]
MKHLTSRSLGTRCLPPKTFCHGKPSAITFQNFRRPLCRGASASNQHTLKPSKPYGRTTSNSLRWDLPSRIPDNRLKKGTSIIWRSTAAINDVSEHCFWRITMPNASFAA